MERLLKVLLTVFALGFFSANAANFTVNMTGFQFSPKDLTVNVGDTVTWVNQDSTLHDTTSGVGRVPSGVWRSSLLRSGQSFSFTFNHAGTFPYYCTPHVFSFNMVGSITVVVPNAPPSVRLRTPQSGATFTEGDNLVIQADASDDNRVARVEFFANGNLIGTDFDAPYSATLNNIAPGNYSLIAAAFDDQGLSATSSVANIFVRELPHLISQPQSQNVFPGSNVIFSVTANGTAPLSFQWQFNGTNISGATTNMLELSNVQTNDAGNYRVIVSNEAGATPSEPAILTVTPLPNIFPTVVLTNPMNGARFRVGSTPLIQAKASDEDGFVAQVEFFLNTALVATLTNAPHEIALSNLAVGNYSVVARATDDDGDATISDAVTFSVLASPSVTITQPGGGARFGLGTNVFFAAAVNAPGLSATSVQFFSQDGNIFSAISPLLTNAPYSFIWNPTSPGTHTLIAMVIDEFGGTNSSATVNIEVFEPGTQNPTIAITNSPKNFSRLTSSPVSISGVANDDIRLERVEFQVNGGPFLPANGTNKWIAEIRLVAGTNVINFRSVDFAGHFSTNAIRTFTYVVNSRLAVQVRGLGTMSPNLDARLLEIGKFYQMTARPAKGQIFGGWEGAAISNKAVLNFAMQSNLVLTVNFIPNPFTAAKGIYTGLIFETNQVRPESSGFIKLQVTSSGSFSGKLTIGGKTFALGGRLDYLGHIKLPVLRRPIKPVVVTLNLNLSGRNQISGEVTDGEWISGLLAKKALATDEAVKRIKQANGAFSFQPIDSSSAEGVIIERASVSSSGTLKFRMLKSGNVFYPTSCLSDDNSAPIYFLSGNEPIPIVGEAKLAE